MKSQDFLLFTDKFCNSGCTPVDSGGLGRSNSHPQPGRSGNETQDLLFRIHSVCA